MAKTRLIDALRKRFATPQLALEALGLDAATIAMDATIPDPKTTTSAITGDTKESTMNTKQWSPTGLAAVGALNTYLAPRLAQDAVIPMAFLKGITAKNFHTSRPAIAKAVKLATDGKLAADADLDDVGEVLDQIDMLADKGREALGEPAEGGEEMNDLDSSAAPEEGEDDDLSELVERIKALSPEDKERLDGMISHSVEPSDPAAMDETEEEKAMRERSAADARAKLGRDETPEEKAKREADFGKARDAKRASDRRAHDAAIESKRIADAKKAADDSKKAMDEAIATERTNQRNIRDAERFVRPWVGELAADLAFDSATDVYRTALEMRGIDVKGKHPDAFRTIIEHLPRAGEKAVNNNGSLAHDSALPRGIKPASERFGTGHIRVMG